MAKVTFLGDVRGYSVGDDGRIWLSVDESEPSREAQLFVHDLTKNFNPSNGKAGFGSRDVPCPIKPGFSSYRVALTKEEASGIAHGSVVELTVDFFFVLYFPERYRRRHVHHDQAVRYLNINYPR